MQGNTVEDLVDEPEFHRDDILVKTDKGNQESRKQTAESSLPRRLRSLLMVVDGKTPFHIYEGMLANYGDVASLYEALETGGYVARVRKRGASQPAEAVETTPVKHEAPSAEAPARSEQGPMKPRPVAKPGMDEHAFSELVSQISTLVENKLGADSLEVLLKLEQAQDPQGLLDILPELTELLEPHLGGRGTKKFASEIRKQLA
jgi:hypothetical protein